MITTANVETHAPRILIVDDERHNRQLLEIMLTPEGFVLLTASSGEEALAMVAEHPPDLILLDVMMPGMDGYQVAGRLKGDNATQNIPVIMVTALADRASRLQGLDAGAEDFLSKPADRAELVARVRNLSRLKAHDDGKYTALAEGSALKDELLSHVSHELRSPLTAIKQFTSMLLDGRAGELNHEQREYQTVVLRNIERLQAMIDDLLEVTRLESGQHTIDAAQVPLRDAVTEAINTLVGTALAKEVKVSCDLPPDLPWVRADRTRVRQILTILLDNAIKFSADAGIVSIQARSFPADPSFVLIEIADTGCGISPQISERIFDRPYQVVPSAQTSRRGLGFGLYICKELVTRQGGEIWVESEPQRGSTFSFTLPVWSDG